MDRNRKGKGNYLPYTYKKKSSKGGMDGRLFSNQLNRYRKNKGTCEQALNTSICRTKHKI